MKWTVLRTNISDTTGKVKAECLRALSPHPSNISEKLFPGPCNYERAFISLY